MSLILDALRKSEAERRKVQAVSDPLAPATQPRGHTWSAGPRGWWAWAAAAALGALLAGWLATRPPIGNAVGQPDRRPEASFAHAPTSAARVPSVPAAEVTAPDVQGDVPDVTSGGIHGDPPEGVPGDGPADASGSATVAARGVESGGRSPVPTGTPPTAPARVATTVPLAAPSAPGASSSGAVPGASPAAAREPAVAISAEPHPVMPRAETLRAEAPLPAAPSREDILRLSDLGTADRKQLPALRMSMHMWAPDPAKRFAIMDGTRVAEGDRVGDAVVQSIDQDGVVLAWNGYRLRVPVR